MDRGGWTVWALSATLIAVALGANAVLMVHDMAAVLEEQSKAFPEEPPWFFRGAGVMITVGTVVLAVAAALLTYGWAKVAAKGKKASQEPKPLFDEEEDDRDPLRMPPGFLAGPKVKMKRHGLAPLIGLNLLGLFTSALAAIILYFAVRNMVEAVSFDGAAFQRAVVMGRLLRFGVLPVAALTGGLLGLAWGTYFPVGRLEVIQEGANDVPARPAKATWNRQG